MEFKDVMQLLVFLAVVLGPLIFRKQQQTQRAQREQAARPLRAEPEPEPTPEPEFETFYDEQPVVAQRPPMAEARTEDDVIRRLQEEFFGAPPVAERSPASPPPPPPQPAPVRTMVVSAKDPPREHRHGTGAHTHRVQKSAPDHRVHKSVAVHRSKDRVYSHRTTRKRVRRKDASRKQARTRVTALFAASSGGLRRAMITKFVLDEPPGMSGNRTDVPGLRQR